MEIWREIKGFENSYQVSSNGRVKSLERYCKTKGGKLRLKKESLLKPGYTLTGYQHVILRNNGEYKSVLIHRLVAEAFIPNPDVLPQVNHKDENKSNNCVDNLEWCTQSYNNIYGTRLNKLSNSLKGRIFTDEHCKKISENKLSKHIHHTDEWKINHSKRMTGQNNPIYGLKRKRVYNDDGTYYYDVINN